MIKRLTKLINNQYLKLMFNNIEKIVRLFIKEITKRLIITNILLNITLKMDPFYGTCL
jgi:hypothetical protein